MLSTIFFTLSAIPVLNAVWTKFPCDSGKTTGFLLFAHGLSSILISIFVCYMFNPDNREATVEY